jgi:hypothetical protein
VKKLLILIACLLQSSVASAALTAHWKLQDNAASTTVVATVGSNGTLTGAGNTSASTAAGPGGTLTASLNLDGTDDYIVIGATDAFDFTTGNAFSVACWFNADALTDRVILGRAGNANRFVDVRSSTQIRVYTSAGAIDFTVPTMSTGTWYHLLVTRDTGNSVKVYLNGTQSSSGAINGGGSFTFDSIGRRATVYWDGKLADVRVYNSEESANVSTIMADGVSASGAVAKILQLLSDNRSRQQSHFDTYGVYSIAP